MSHKKKPLDQRDKGAYPREHLRNAVRSVINGEMSASDADKQFNIPL